MKRFIGFLKKEFYHIFRDKRSMLILFGMPIVQLLLFGFVITNDLKDVKMAVLDHSKDEYTSEIINKIVSSGYFNLVENLDNITQVDETFRKGETKVVLVFEPDFGKKLIKGSQASVQILTDASDPNMANMEVNYLQGILQNYNVEINRGKQVPNQITPQTRMYFNSKLESVYMFVPGIMATILMLVSAMMTSISIAREKELGTMEILLVSPLRPLQIILGKVTPYLILSFINALVIVGVGYFVFGVPVLGSFALLMTESLLFILLALSLGIYISTVSNSQQVAMMLSMFALMLPTILLSGFIFPLRNMPLPLQIISNIIPPRWFIVIIKNIMLKGTGLEFVWKETLILIGMTAGLIGLSVKKFKIRLE
ncbi:ABC-2 type transport system permease protein [Ancylomarina subtilis]|uniref:ABC-2 type transport system permease protein n=1 Tax=Ancylomarina subtilis TaxID=1639035 RepID=A0A4Q7VHF8_9BACT|nr:ABC transporter permease [Ancylomarina subtilis]RZT95513.1 ABC-2 type transport system permease protein [Ancylomarina subtilis]